MRKKVRVLPASWLHALLICFFISSVGMAAQPSRWIVSYGPHLLPKDLERVGMAVLDPDALPAYAFKDQPVQLYGYLSVGEAEAHRKYWPDVAGKKFLAGENPLWPGAHLADIRSKEWRSFLLERRIPEILARGYGGLFLDTVDTAAILEESDPVRYAGSKKAMVDFVREIKRRYPDLLLLPNNATEFLDQYGGVIEGVVVEGLYTRYDFEKKIYGKTPVAETRGIEALLDGFQSKYQKPVFNLIYEKSVHTPLARYAIKRSRQKGYLWYRTTVDLMQLGTVSP